MIKKCVYDNSHLTLEQRKTIQNGIETGLSKADIAKMLSKDPSTIGKEIKKHRKLKPRNPFNIDTLCIHLKECHRCIKKCENYEEPKCSRRNRSPRRFSFLHFYFLKLDFTFSIYHFFDYEYW